MIRVSFTKYMILGYELSGRTVVDTFRDRLEKLDIERGSAAVVPIFFVFLIADDTACPFGGRESDGGRLGYPGNNLTGVEGENGRVRIHAVRVENFRNVLGFEDRFGEVRSERIFIRTTSKIQHPPQCCGSPKEFLPGISPCLC